MHTQTTTQPAFNNQTPFMACAQKNKQLEQEKQDLQVQLDNSQAKVAELQAKIDAMNAPSTTPDDLNVVPAGLDGLGSGA